MSQEKKLTTNAGAPVVDNQNVMTAGPCGPALLKDVWFLEKLAHFDREVIPERRMHAKGSGAYGTFTVTHDISKYTKAKIFSKVGKKTDLFVRFSTVAGERGAADAERDIRGFAMKFYTPDLNHAHHHHERPGHSVLVPTHARLRLLPVPQLPSRRCHAGRRQPRQHAWLRTEQLRRVATAA